MFKWETSDAQTCVEEGSTFLRGSLMGKPPSGSFLPCKAGSFCGSVPRYQSAHVSRTDFRILTQANRLLCHAGCVGKDSDRARQFSKWCDSYTIVKVAPTTDWWSQGQSSWLSWPLFTVIASGEMVSQFMTFKTAGHYQVKQCHSSWSSLSSETGSEFMPFWSLSSETGSEFILFTYVLFFT